VTTGPGRGGSSPDRFALAASLALAACAEAVPGDPLGWSRLETVERELAPRAAPPAKAAGGAR
jgi:hypothetical protein